MPRAPPPGIDALDEFRCCDTTWRVGARGPSAAEGVRAARETALALEARLNAFSPTSAVARLHREGRVVDADIARIVARADEYRKRTRGVFDVARGSLEHAIKRYIRGEAERVAPEMRGRARYHVEGDVVTTDAPLDLNGIAKGYVVDRAHDALVAAGATGFVDGGGDISSPTGPVGIESPYDAKRTLAVLDTRWNVATSGRAKRRRGGVDHLYDPRSGRVGARHDQVTVVAKRDATEADVLATVLCVLPLDEGRTLAESWGGVAALWVDAGDITTSRGFEKHAWKAPSP